MFSRWLTALLCLACTTAASASTCPTSGYLRLVNVGTAAKLGSALSAAIPGDQIRLAAGQYNGRWTITRSGTAANPITLCGPRTAILQGADLTGTELYLNGADYWQVIGLTLRKSQVSVGMKHGSNFNLFQSLDMSGTGLDAVTIKDNSKHNTVLANEIHGTGLTTPQYGEGVYIGTTESQWVNGVPDHSDSNVVYGNHIYNTKADGIQTMAGTTGTIIRKNTIDGAGMVKGNVDGTPPHWVLVMGNAIITDSNTATNALTYGMKVRRSTTAPSWATNAVFRANRMTSGRSQAAIYLETPPANGMIVYCDNVRTDSLVGPRSNLACTSLDSHLTAR